MSKNKMKCKIKDKKKIIDTNIKVSKQTIIQQNRTYNSAPKQLGSTQTVKGSKYPASEKIKQT